MLRKRGFSSTFLKQVRESVIESGLQVVLVFLSAENRGRWISF